VSGDAELPRPPDALLRQRRLDRHRFLAALYARSDADVGAYEDGRDLADGLGIPLPEAERIVRYLEERGFVQHLGGGGLTLRITAAGIDHVESSGMDG
jgi:hypothetical protein